MRALPERPFCVLIAALGGEGGGVLADWLVEAASGEDYPVQSTSIPGVSQRTGATTYYVEIFPARRADLGGREPVMALTPTPGGVDVMLASELVEAGRAMQNGFVSPDRTALFASTHRIYATSEKIEMGDGRYAAQSILEAAPRVAQRAVLFDMARAAQEAGSIINTVLFGAMAGSGALPLSREACERAIRASGKSVEASLRGFAAGFAMASSGAKAPAVGAEGSSAPAAAAPAIPKALGARIAAAFPFELHGVLALGVARLVDYLDAGYAGLYLDRLEAVLGAERGARGEAAAVDVTREAARQLAVWMSYEDVIRVADLKTRRSRFERVRREIGAKPGQPLAIVDYFKPGPAELADILTPAWAERMRRRAAGPRPVTGGIELKTTSIAGFVLLRAVSLLRIWRRRTARYAEEQALIERWLAEARRFAGVNPEIALEVVGCARLIKGYSDTHARGRASFTRLFAALVEGAQPAPGLAQRIRAAREAALADEGGDRLTAVLSGQAPAGPAVRVQTIAFAPRKARPAKGAVGAAEGR